MTAYRLYQQWIIRRILAQNQKRGGFVAYPQMQRLIILSDLDKADWHARAVVYRQQLQALYPALRVQLVAVHLRQADTDPSLWVLGKSAVNRLTGLVKPAAVQAQLNQWSQAVWIDFTPPEAITAKSLMALAQAPFKVGLDAGPWRSLYDFCLALPQADPSAYADALLHFLARINHV